jgi:hypothetical protein
MFDYLDRLREKPENVRFKIAISIAAFVTLVIFLVWLSVISMNSSSGDEDIVRNDTEVQSQISIFRENLSDVIDGGKGGVEKIRRQFGSIEYEAQ